LREAELPTSGFGIEKGVFKRGVAPLYLNAVVIGETDTADPDAVGSVTWLGKIL
jgi:hypothetical protein